MVLIGGYRELEYYSDYILQIQEYLRCALGAHAMCVQLPDQQFLELLAALIFNFC